MRRKTISVAELHVGVREGIEKLALEQLISTLEVADLTSSIAARGGMLSQDRGKSYGIGINDALITATAEVLGLGFFTSNLEHYPMLDVENIKEAYLMK